MSDSRDGIRTKIERTKKHIGDLDFAVKAFLDSGPYKVGTKRDPDTRKLIYYVTELADVPSDVPQIAGDALGNMVAILDHLAYRFSSKAARAATHTFIFRLQKSHKCDGIRSHREK